MWNRLPTNAWPSLEVQGLKVLLCDLRSLIRLGLGRAVLGFVEHFASRLCKDVEAQDNFDGKHEFPPIVL